MRTVFLSFLIVVLAFGCNSEYNNSPATQTESIFTQGRIRLFKSRDTWQFSNFVNEISKLQQVEKGDELQSIARQFLPDSTIHEGHSLHARVLQHQDSFQLIYYEYFLQEGHQSNMYIGVFNKEGDATDVLCVKEVSFDGSIIINVVDGEIVEIKYYDFFRLNNHKGEAIFTDFEADLSDNWHSTAVKNFSARDEIVEFYHFENFKLSPSGKFEILSRPDSVNLQRSYPHASLYVLSFEELSEYSAIEWREIINEIYAAHKFIFRSEELSNQFLDKPWYQPVHENVDHLLSDIEKVNINKISALELSIK